MKLAHGIEKPLLKKGAEALLPHEVIYREKDGFTVPLKQLIASEIESHTAPMLTRFNAEAELFTPAMLQAYMRGNAREAWQPTSLAQWYDTFGVSMA
jgi:asparagine synthetase B (glutamine-hydrolysing)